MITITTSLYLLAVSAAGPLRRAHSDQRGEGVISAAIAVLIMALLGAAMWATFDSMFTETTERTNEQVGTIGRE